MQYRHKVTGVIIDIPSEISGAWEPVKQTETPEPAVKPAKKKKKEG